MKQFLAMEILLLSLVCPSLGQAWNGKQDNKAVSELMQLPDHDLPYEALGPCIYVTFWNGRSNELYALPALHKVKVIRRKREAMQYLKSIQQVAQKKLRGETPRWVENMLKASSGKDVRECVAAWQKLLEERIRSLAEKSEKVSDEERKAKTPKRN